MLPPAMASQMRVSSRMRHYPLLGIPTLFIYPLVWMANIAEELKGIAIKMSIGGPRRSWWHMFGWNTFGLLLMGPAVATGRFFSTLNKIEQKLNHED